jgi:hypothetical protein
VHAQRAVPRRLCAAVPVKHAKVVQRVHARRAAAAAAGRCCRCRLLRARFIAAVMPLLLLQLPGCASDGTRPQQPQLVW